MHVICPGCQAVNRVSPDRAQGAQPVCGKCKAALVPEASGFPVEVGDGDFEAQVKQAGVPVLVDFWGPSCPPCRQLEPVLKEFAKEMAGKLKVVKVNTEQCRRLPGDFAIRAVPTLILFREGQEVARSSGFRPLHELRAFASQAR
jgi:thioredoxin 2